MSDSNYNWTPAAQAALGIDPDGSHDGSVELPFHRRYASLPVHKHSPRHRFRRQPGRQVCHSPKRSHASAVKTLVRYLHRTSDMGMIVKPTGTLNLDCYVDADFAGLHGRDPDRSPTSAKSRTGSAMRTLLPLRSMLQEVASGIKLPRTFTSTIKCQVFEDNNGALLLAVNQRITNRTKYFQVKWHFFWQHVRDGTVAIVKVDTQEQWADFLTKGLNRESFERVRKLVQGW
ncbi:hypothetical protein MHU86_15794 [Fragilaria crotonensis]|nr:hypothetical protein MHU86_15794 [Fragilaria crotonensis]